MVHGHGHSRVNIEASLARMAKRQQGGRRLTCEYKPKDLCSPPLIQLKIIIFNLHSFLALLPLFHVLASSPIEISILSFLASHPHPHPASLGILSSSIAFLSTLIFLTGHKKQLVDK